MFGVRRAIPALVVIAATGIAVATRTTTVTGAGAGGIDFETPAIVDPIHTYGEPDVGIAPNGGVFASGPWGTGTQHSIWNGSVDGGHTFRVVNQGAPPNPAFGIDSPPGGGDTDIAFDRSSKQYFIDLAAAECFRTETTTTNGSTSNQNDFGGCGTAGPGADRQWYVVYDPPPGTPNRSAYTGPKPVIYLEYAAAVSAILVGVSTHTQWNFSNATNDPEPGGPGLLFAPATPVGTTGPVGTRGYPAIDQVTGKVFEANNGSGGLVLNIGTPNADGTLCFLDSPASTQCPVAGTGTIVIDGTHTSNSLLGPVVSMDAGRNLWAVWDSGHQTYISVTPPDNDKWDQWVQVSGVPSGIRVSGNLPNDKEDVFPWIKAGGAGRADVVWYGEDQAVDPSSQVNQNWNVFMSQVVFATDANGAVIPTPAPSQAEVQVTPHPMHYNDICLNGTGCITNMPPGNRNLADFFQVNIDASGAAEVIYNDTSNLLFQAGTEPNGNQNADHKGAAVVTLARQNAGLGLYGTPVSGPSSAPTGGLTDPNGDALFPVIAGGTPASSNVPGLDVLDSELSLSGSTLTVTMKVLDISNPAATAAAVGGAPFLQYITRWQMGNTIYFAGVENPVSATGTAAQFYAGKAQSIDLCSVSGCTPHVTLYPEGAASNPNIPLGSPETGTVSCPTSPSVSTPCTLTVAVNTADIGSPTSTSLLEEVGGYSFASSHLQAEITNAQAQADNTPLEIDGVCCYNFQGNTVVVAEFRTPLLALLAAVGLVALGRRRLRARRA